MSSCSFAKLRRTLFYCLLALMLMAAGFAITQWTAASETTFQPTNLELTGCQSNDREPLQLPPQDSENPVTGDSGQTSAALKPSDSALLTVTLFQYDAAAKVGVTGLELEILWKDDGPDLPHQAHHTDELGQVITLVPPEITISIVLNSPFWRFAGQPYTTEKRAYVAGSTCALSLQVERVCQFTVDVTYEDGRRYSGVAMVSPDSGAPSVLLMSEESSKVLVLPAGKKWTLFAPSRRSGFTSGELLLDEGVGEVSNSLILRRDDDNSGVFEVQCDNAADGLLVNIRISADADSVSTTTLDEVSNWPSTLPYFSTTLAPGAYVVRVQVSSDSEFGRAALGLEVAELVAGQTQTVRVRLAPPGSVRAVVVDENNQPIAKARLALANATHFNWHWAREEPPGYQHDGSDAYALSGHDGVVVLTGSPAGTIELICDAEGCGQVLLHAVVLPGAEHDFGTIVLVAAAGKIKILIDHPEATETDEYEVTLLKPLGGIVRSAQRFNGKSHIIEGLPLLTYVVSIRYVAGGFGAYAKEAMLDTEAPEAVLKFVMRKPPLKPAED